MDDDLAFFMNAFTARQTLEMAYFDALLDTLEEVARAAGVTDLDGLAVRQWWEQRQRERLRLILLRYEDENPPLAAHILKLLDKAGHSPFLSPSDGASAGD